MRIAVYTIAKNEEQFVKRWYDSCKEADYIIVVDTGSEDNTVHELEDAHLNVPEGYPSIEIYDATIKPWRFEIARNFNLNLIPADADICICLDMDEVLVEGWRDIVEAAWKVEQFDRLRYTYVWSWNEDNTPAVTYHGDKIHARHGFRWVNPVHEVLVKDSRLGEERQMFIDDTLIKHYPDDTKSRANYLPLLGLATREDPYNDRNAHYYARELFFVGDYHDAIKEFERHIALPTAKWNSEKAASYRFMGDCYWALGNKDYAMICFDNACKEAPNEREPWVAKAQAHRANKEWIDVKNCCDIALAITVRPSSYINQPWAWSTWPQEMLDEANEIFNQLGEQQ